MRGGKRGRDRVGGKGSWNICYLPFFCWSGGEELMGRELEFEFS